MKQSTSSKNTNSIFLKRLSHPVKLGLNQNNAYAYNSQLNQYSNIPPTRSTNNELATKPPKLSLSYKRSSIQSQHVITKNQLAFSKDHVDLSKSESNSNKIQVNICFFFLSIFLIYLKKFFNIISFFPLYSLIIHSVNKSA